MACEFVDVDADVFEDALDAVDVGHSAFGGDDAFKTFGQDGGHGSASPAVLCVLTLARFFGLCLSD